MPLPKPFLLISLIAIFSSCKNEQSNSYSINDFRKAIQPFLRKVVSESIVRYHDTADMRRITDEELLRLGKSENQVLRATALREMLTRNSFNHFDVLMNHLDDTAIVATDNGEFGIWFERVSDYLIENNYWDTPQARDQTIESVLTKHNYLSSAYNILTRIPPEEKYYTLIKNMAIRPRRISRYDGDELKFSEIEYALYGLASFQKKEDVQIIKSKLMMHVWQLSDVSFWLMKEFPDTAYMEVLRAYHRRQFYHFSGFRPHGFTGYNNDKAAPEDFVDALVVQKNNSSSKLLDTMLAYLPKCRCMPDKKSILNYVIEQIWDHPCAAYAELRQRIKNKAEQLERPVFSFPMDSLSFPVDTSKKRYHWYY